MIWPPPVKPKMTLVARIVRVGGSQLEAMRALKAESKGRRHEVRYIIMYFSEEKAQNQSRHGGNLEGRTHHTNVNKIRPS